MRRATWRLLLAAILLFPVAADAHSHPPDRFSKDEWQRVQSLALTQFPPLPPNPSNKYGDNKKAAAFGQKMFFDTGFSVNGKVSCASCHDPAKAFTDGRVLAEGVGTANRNTMGLIGAAYSPWFFWDGRKDSQWSQALEPLENPVEHGGNRLMYVKRLVGVPGYRRAYRSLFGRLPEALKNRHLPAPKVPVTGTAYKSAWSGLTDEDRKAVNTVFANMGKALASYQRTLEPKRSRFDDFADGRGALTEEELTGLKIFIGKGTCLQCHNGPLFTNNDFHNTGTPASPLVPPNRGRALGIGRARADEFNCWGPYSDAPRDNCAELNFAKTLGPELEGAHKTPGLRNLSKTAPYMHAGQFKTLREVIHHYNGAPEAIVGRSELVPLKLTINEMAALEAFLRVLE